MHILPLEILLPDADEMTHARQVGLCHFEKLVNKLIDSPEKPIKKLITRKEN